MTVDAAQYFSAYLAVVLFEQNRAKLPGCFAALPDQLDEFRLGQHDRADCLRHMLTQDNVLQFAVTKVMYSFPFEKYG